MYPQQYRYHSVPNTPLYPPPPYTRSGTQQPPTHGWPAYSADDAYYDDETEYGTSSRTYSTTGSESWHSQSEMHGIGHSNAVADSGYGAPNNMLGLSGVGDDRRTAPRNRTHSYSAPQVDYSYGYVESRRRYRPASPGQSRTRVFSDPPRPSHIAQTPGCRTASPHFERHLDSIVVAQELKNRPRGWARIKQRLLRPLSVLKPRRGSEPAQNVATWVHSNYVHVPLHAPMGYPTFEMTPVFGTAAPLGLTDMFGNPGLPHHARRHNR